jgi:tetratricopeptide (TPR) repeat protein
MIMRIFHNSSLSPAARLCLFFILFTILSFSGKIQIVSAQNTIQLNADTQLEFADHCFDNQDFEAAALEYKKFIYFFNDDARAPFAEFRIGMSYFHNNAYAQALNQFTRILDQNGVTDTGILSAFMISRCYQRMRNYPSAINNLIYLKQLTDDADLTDKIYYQLGWLYLETGDFIKARSVFSNISIVHQVDFDTKKLNADLSIHNEIPQKNSITAGILSIIPGGGYLYCGRYQDALTAFLVNSALMYGAYECFDADLYALGGMITALEVGFYAGNVYGGISSAHKYNQSRKNEFVQNLKIKFNPDVHSVLNPDLSMRIKPKGILLGMTYRF